MKAVLGCEAPGGVWMLTCRAVLGCEAPGGVWTLRWQVLLGPRAAEGSIVKVWFLLHHCTPCRCRSTQTHRSICTGQLETLSR